MDKKGFSDRSPEEKGEAPLGEFQDLKRGRELFLQLFCDATPLANLRYTSRQITYARSAIDAIAEGKGKVETISRANTFMRFPYPINEQTDTLAFIGEIPRKQGYYLDAWRVAFEEDETKKNLGYEEPYSQNSSLLSPNDWYPVFLHDLSTVLKVFLLNSEKVSADITLLSRLFISHLPYTKMIGYRARRVSSPHDLMPIEDLTYFRGLQPENPVTTAAKSAGLVCTYQARWIDQQTKMELMFKITPPEAIPSIIPGLNPLRQSPYYFSFKRLAPISDARGNVIPFGKRANVSDEEGKSIFAREAQTSVSGKLAPDFG